MVSGHGGVAPTRQGFQSRADFQLVELDLQYRE
jgi:hypothetical protein